MSTKFASVSDMKEGSNIVIDGVACKVTGLQYSRPGKHGHAKVRLETIGMIDEKKRVVVMPGHDNVEVPLIDKRGAQILSITGENANVMDLETFETFDLSIPAELKGQVAEGSNILYWQILNDRIMKQLKSGEQQ